MNPTQVYKSANYSWDLFNMLPQDLKTRVITLGLVNLVAANFKDEEIKPFWKAISGD